MKFRPDDLVTWVSPNEDESAEDVMRVVWCDRERTCIVNEVGFEDWRFKPTQIVLTDDLQVWTQLGKKL